MSTINITKGYPVNLTIGVSDDNDNPVNLNDGTWTVDAELHYQTSVGPMAPFSLVPTPSANSIVIAISANQTNSLDHLGTGYVLLIRANKNDETIFLKTKIQMSVDQDV